MIDSCSIVIPVYKSSEILEELIIELNQALAEVYPEHEVILVNDGSPDRSWQVIEELSSRFPRVRGINMMRNYGQHNALLCGIRAAKYPVLVTMDDDLQHPPAEIPHLLKRLDEGYDVVYGSPRHERHGLWRDLASQITKLALRNTMGVDIAQNVSAFRAIRTQVRQAFANYQGPYVNLDVLLTWGTNRFSAITVDHKPRRRGESSYTLRKLLVHALNMITGFSILPLQLASLMGFVFAVFGLLVLIYVVGRYLIQGGSVPGFPFLASTIAIFSGVQLFAIGIIGEYLARMHFRLMDRPPYVIAEQTPTSTPSETESTILQQAENSAP
jgi:undecaprenyl-phosphate 4-deoxy-4-formamido-L-arabinose transferase